VAGSPVHSDKHTAQRPTTEVGEDQLPPCRMHGLLHQNNNSQLIRTRSSTISMQDIACPRSPVLETCEQMKLAIPYIAPAWTGPPAYPPNGMQSTQRKNNANITSGSPKARGSPRNRTLRCPSSGLQKLRQRLAPKLLYYREVLGGDRYVTLNKDYLPIHWCTAGNKVLLE
jgi:hypothetical protein